MATLSQPRMPQDSERNQLGTLPILAWSILGVLAAVNLQFDWAQDIVAYADNIERTVTFGEIIRDDGKTLWYDYLVFPIWSVVNDVEGTLIVLKCFTMALFFYSTRKNLRNWTDALLVIFLVVFTPVVSDNLNEYLRQGNAAGLFLLAISFSRRELRWPLLITALMVHQAVIFLIVAFYGGLGLFKLCFDRSRRVNWNIVALGGGALLVATVLGLSGAKALSVLTSVWNTDFLIGNRSNILAPIYLMAYGAYLGFRTVAHRSANHCIAFVGILLICALYSVILDFGRSMSLILPLHLAAAVSLGRLQDRYIDMLAIFLGGAAFLLAGA